MATAILERLTIPCSLSKTSRLFNNAANAANAAAVI
jgi:hypothetical protein